MSVPPPYPEINLLYVTNFGLFSNLLKNQCDITLMDAPVSYKAYIIVLFTLTLYKIALFKLTSSTMTSLMTLSSQLESRTSITQLHSSYEQFGLFYGVARLLGSAGKSSYIN